MLKQIGYMLFNHCQCPSTAVVAILIHCSGRIYVTVNLCKPRILTLPDFFSGIVNISYIAIVAYIGIVWIYPGNVDIHGVNLY